MHLPDISSILTAGIAPWIPYVSVQEVVKTDKWWAFPTYEIDPRIKLVEIGKSRLLDPLTKIPHKKYLGVFPRVWEHYNITPNAPEGTPSTNPFQALPADTKEVALMRKLTDIPHDKHINTGSDPTNHGVTDFKKYRLSLFSENNELVKADERKLYDKIALKIFREAGISHKIVASYAVKSLVTGFIVGLTLQTFGSLIENFILPDSPRKITPDDMNTLFTNAGIDALSCGATSALYSAGLLLFLVSPAAPMTIIVEGGLGILVNIAMHKYLDDKFLPSQTT